MVRKGGFEPPRPCEHKLLRLARLPVPPLPRCDRSSGQSWTGDYSWKVEGTSTGAPLFENPCRLGSTLEFDRYLTGLVHGN